MTTEIASAQEWLISLMEKSNITSFTAVDEYDRDTTILDVSFTEDEEGTIYGDWVNAVHNTLLNQFPAYDRVETTITLSNGTLAFDVADHQERGTYFQD